MAESGWTLGVFLRCFIVALLLLRHDDLLTFTVSVLLSFSIGQDLSSVAMFVVGSGRGNARVP